MTLAEKILSFNKSLSIRQPLPADVEVMNPYMDKNSFALCKLFYTKYYNDHNRRTVILGINPGRFGGGVTGIPFTDPVKLEHYCGIANDLKKKTELSADFIYQMIQAFGGPEKFYSKFYISAISPLGFTKEGKNMNYYDSKELQESLSDFIITSLQKQIAFGLNTETCYCLGEGQNFKFLRKLNETHRFFKKVVPLAHPRFIMQYKRKKVSEYVEKYVETMSE